jgi:hypothetical protein
MFVPEPVWLQLCSGIVADDMTPRQHSLSGVIICPALRKGQRLKVNSFTSTLIES